MQLPEQINYFRFLRIAESKLLLTTDTGEYIFLNNKDFDKLINGKIEKSEKLWKDLEEKNILLTDINRIIEKYRTRNSYHLSGPQLFVIVATLRCNQSCKYCQVSHVDKNKTEYDLNIETAKKIVDNIFKLSNGPITIEFQGGEPLVNWEAVKFITQYSKEKAKQENKQINVNLVTNLSLMDEEKLSFLYDNRIYICTSLDGPQEIHDHLRPMKGDSSHYNTVKWIEKINSFYINQGEDSRLYHVDALMTATRFSLNKGIEIVEEYFKYGIPTIHLRPLSPLGFARVRWNEIGYKEQDFVKFYNETLDYIINKNLEGIELIERGAAINLAKILSDFDPGYVDQRSPCGAGLGQIAYDYDGSIYTCDEARMLGRGKDYLFKIGHVDGNIDLKENEVIKTCAVASCLDSLPLCRDCVFNPYCGVCPVYEYATNGNPFGPRITSKWCYIKKETFKKIFSLLEKNNKEINKIFNRWIIQRVR